MAKDNRKILNAVRHGGKVYKDGMEDELSAALDQAALDRLNDKGHLGGDWKAVAKVEAPAEAEPEAETKGKKK